MFANKTKFDIHFNKTDIYFLTRFLGQGRVFFYIELHYLQNV